jgi:predicted metal-dependent phosphoesterase TrpH
MYHVNAHVHTPYSFSAFENLTDALDQAVCENVKVVGINDFYSTDGYDEWHDGAFKRRIFPLFNIEMISLQKEDQSAGIRVNDPNNPGRTYLSGKGLRYPAFLPEPYATLLADVRSESNKQVNRMCQKLSDLPEMKQTGIQLDFDRILKDLTKGAVRERHVAKALRLEVYKCMDEESKAIAAFFKALFNGKALKAEVDNHAAVENEIRGNLLKAGGTAFIPEDPKTFLPFETVCEIILAAGGIPTYPFLADNEKGEFTDFEKDLEKAACLLKQRGIFAVEFISPRNSIETLEQYAAFLSDNGFVVTLGSEHNTPAPEPIELFARGQTPLTGRLKQINYEGACVIAAHQERIRNGKQGYVDIAGNACATHREEFIREGNAIIQNYFYYVCGETVKTCNGK